MTEMIKETTAAKKSEPCKADEIGFEITPETHAVSLMLVSPSQLGRAFTNQDNSAIRQALDDLDLSENGHKAAAKLMQFLSTTQADLDKVRDVQDMLGNAYAGSEPHPTRTHAWTIVARLKGIS